MPCLTNTEAHVSRVRKVITISLASVCQSHGNAVCCVARSGNVHIYFFYKGGRPVCRMAHRRTEMKRRRGLCKGASGSMRSWRGRQYFGSLWRSFEIDPSWYITRPLERGRRHCVFGEKKDLRARRVLHALSAKKHFEEASLGKEKEGHEARLRSWSSLVHLVSSSLCSVSAFFILGATHHWPCSWLVYYVYFFFVYLVEVRERANTQRTAILNVISPQGAISTTTFCPGTAKMEVFVSANKPVCVLQCSNNVYHSIEIK